MMIVAARELRYIDCSPRRYNDDNVPWMYNTWGMDTLGDTLSGHTSSLFILIYHIMSDLYDAARNGDLGRVRVLVEQGVDKDRTSDYGSTPLCIASQNGHMEVLRYLVEQGAEMKKASSGGWTPLAAACYYGHLEVVRFLLEQGSNVNKVDVQGFTSLHWAAFHGRLDTAKLLMVYGADLNVRNSSGWLPIEMGNRNTEEIRQAIRDEPQRRWDQQPRKRCVEQEQHSEAATSSASAQQQGKEATNSKQSAVGEAAEGEVADETRTPSRAVTRTTIEYSNE